MNLAVIGLGPHGIRLVESAKRIESINVVAIIDRDLEKMNNPKFDFIPHKLNSLGQLWEINLKVDILLIATNGPSHAPIALEAIEKGVKYLMVCKPIACTVEDALSIELAAKENNVRVVVDHGLRYDNTYTWIKQHLTAKTWGALLSIYIYRPGIGLGCLGVHSFDLANFLVGDTPQNVTAWIDKPKGNNPRGAEFVDPGGLVILNYADEQKAIISQIEVGVGPMLVEVITENAKITVNEKFGEIEIIKKDTDAKAAPGRPIPLSRVINPNDIEVKHDIYNLMTDAILDLKGEASIQADCKVGINSVSILAAAYMSDANGHSPYMLPLMDSVALKKFLPVT